MSSRSVEALLRLPPVEAHQAVPAHAAFIEAWETPPSFMCHRLPSQDVLGALRMPCFCRTIDMNKHELGVQRTCVAGMTGQAQT